VVCVGPGCLVLVVVVLSFVVWKQTVRSLSACSLRLPPYLLSARAFPLLLFPPNPFLPPQPRRAEVLVPVLCTCFPVCVCVWRLVESKGATRNPTARSIDRPAPPPPLRLPR